MIDLSQTEISEEAVEQLPADWAEQLANGLAVDYLFGYDAELDAAHVWYSTHRAHAVQIPLASLIDVTIDDETEQVIGFVVHQFTEVALAIMPDLEPYTVYDDASGKPRLTTDISMIPIRKVSSVVPVDAFRRTLTRVAHLVAA